MNGAGRLQKTGRRGRPKKPAGAGVVVSVRVPAEIVAQLDAEPLSRSEAIRLLLQFGLGLLCDRPPLSDEALAVLARRGWVRDRRP